jgi:hypothetical protein
MALRQPSPPPTRCTSGSTENPPYWPMAQCGLGDPFFYHMFFDDFDQTLGVAGNYTITATGVGTTALTPGDGGLALFTTAATANAQVSAQTPTAGFVLPGTGATPPGTSNSSFKLFYKARLQVAHASTDSFVAGLCGISGTIYTAGVQTITDGLAFYKAPGSTAIQLLNIASAGNSPTGSSVSNAFTIPGFVVANATMLEVAYYIDPYQNIRAWIANNLTGYFVQSGTGATDAFGVPITPVLGPNFANYNFLAQNPGVGQAAAANPLVFSTANLAPTLAVNNGSTAAVTTMTSDFHVASKER